MDKKKIAIILLIAILVIVLIAVLVNKNDNNEVINNDGVALNPISTKKTTSKYEMYNTDIKVGSGTTKITAEVENISNTVTDEQKVTVVLLNKEGNELGTIPVTIPKLDVGKSAKISTQVLTEYEGIYDFRLE